MQAFLTAVGLLCAEKFLSVNHSLDRVHLDLLV
jgi:hypothetical protein